MVLILTRGGSTKRVPLRLPASPAEEMEAFERLDTISTNMSTTRVADAVSPIPNLAHHIKNVYFDGLNYEKLKQLAERLEHLTETEQYIFNGALEAENVCGLDDILNIVDHLEDYELNEDVICDRDLGGWLVKHDVLGINFPETVRPYLDYVAIGAKYYKSHSGAYTLHGYVKKKEVSPQLAAEEKNVLRLTLASSKNAFTLGLPATEQQLEAAKRALDVEDFAQAEIHGVEFAPDYQTATIPTDCVTVEDANELAFCLQQMSTDEMKTYRAALEVEEPGTFTEALNIAMDKDDYELISNSEREYGREALRRIGADDELLDTIDGYTDFEQLGRDMMKEDGVRQTGYGLIRRLSSPFPPEQEIGQTMM